MKTLSSLLFTGIIIILVSACQDNRAGADLHRTSDADRLQKVSEISTIHRNDVPFAVKFFSEGGVQPPSDETIAVCGEPQPPNFLNVQNGEGVGTYLGTFTYASTFCVDGTDILDGVLEEGESIPYYENENTHSVMTAANGDQLFIGIASGEVLPATTPGFDFEFHDRFNIRGGTGQFEGARGRGMATGITTQSPERTEHIWTGTIRLRD